MKVLTIGSSPQCDVVINIDDIDSVHCQILQDDNDTYRLVTFGNNIRVNGEAVSGDIALDFNWDWLSINKYGTCLYWQHLFSDTNRVEKATNKYTIKHITDRQDVDLEKLRGCLPMACMGRPLLHNPNPYGYVYLLDLQLADLFLFSKGDWNAESYPDVGMDKYVYDCLKAKRCDSGHLFIGEKCHLCDLKTQFSKSIEWCEKAAVQQLEHNDVTALDDLEYLYAGDATTLKKYLLKEK